MSSTQVFTLIDTVSMTATLFKAVRPPTCLLVGGSEGGMKRALACSYDPRTGTFYRETVLRIPSQCVSRMDDMQRIRLGLRKPFHQGGVTAFKRGHFRQIHDMMKPFHHNQPFQSQMAKVAVDEEQIPLQQISMTSVRTE
jgi:hypothetical protein